MRSKKTSIRDFEKLYTHPSAILFRSIELLTVYEQTKDLIFKQPSLDLGSGDGKIARLIFDEKFTYGVDNGEADDYQEAIDNNRYDKVLLESAEKMSLADNSVNFVFSNSVVEHIPDCDAVISEVSRILKPGGSYIFTAPSHMFSGFLFFYHIFSLIGLRFVANFYSKLRNKMLNHYHLYSFDEWGQKLSAHGLKLKKYEYYLSKKVIKVWDIMAWKCFFGRIIFRNKIDSIVYSKYKNKIKELYINKSLEGELGGGIFIHCVKE